MNQRKGSNGFRLLENTLERAGFWNILERRRRTLRRSVKSFRIVIKPDLEMFDALAPTGTNPRLVEHLIAVLHRRGYGNVAVVDGLPSSDLWLENREVSILADLAGYRYKTDEGAPYRVVNLNEHLVDAQFGTGSVLAGCSLGQDWLAADFRIGFAKNKTHQEYGFALGLQSAMGVLPLRDKEYHYFHRFDPGEVCCELIRHTPLHFAIIDAVVSNHGSDGVFTVNPISTNTIIASQDPVLCDFAAAMKMNVDPYLSPVNAAALRSIGLPKRYEIRGDLTPYEGWRNVSPVLAHSARLRNSSVIAHRMAQSWLQAVNRDLFPFKNDIDERINNAFARFLNSADDHPLGLAGWVGLNYLIAWCSQIIQAYNFMFDKERIARRKTSLGFDVSKYGRSDFEDIVAYIEPLAQLVSQTPPDRNGLRWRYLDHSVVFQYQRLLPIPFRKFVSRVDISAGVRMLNDNIGGALTVVERDKGGRAMRQAERNIYLPQPNWIAVFGGDVIDVGKLELIRYEKDRQRIFWKTVTSANKSAHADDGLITFAAGGKRTTQVTIVARQEFTLPLFWQVFNIDYLPQVKDALISDSYVTFFSRSMANYEAAFDGRDTRTGRDWEEAMGEEGAEKPWIPVEQLVDRALKLLQMAQPLIDAIRKPAKPDHTEDAAETAGSTAGTERMAAEIFSVASNAARSFFRDFLEAVRKDAALLGQMPWDGAR